MDTKELEAHSSRMACDLGETWNRNIAFLESKFDKKKTQQCVYTALIKFIATITASSNTEGFADFMRDLTMARAMQEVLEEIKDSHE